MYATYPAISSSPQGLGVVVATTFTIKLPAVEPQAGSGVHKVVDMHQELVLGCSIMRW